MSADLLMAATAALREVGNGPESSMSDPVAESTRRRVMASIGEHKQGNRRRLALVVFALALSTATLSWAASTGRLKQVLRQLHVVESAPPGQREQPDEVPGPVRVARVEPAMTVPMVMAAMPEPMPEPVRKPAPKRAKRAPSPTATAAVDGDLADYRKAHGVHFRGGDASAALAAWDDYLTANPDGRFVAEAAYNRAITLVRLGRKREAGEALAPFAAGEMGYRRDEAAKLREALR